MVTKQTKRSLLIDRIGELTTNDHADAHVLRNAAVVIDENGVIAWVGASKNAPAADEWFNADGRAVLPGWIDSHTHMVFGGDRTREFEARMAGAAYRTGGINASVAATRSASDDELERNLSRLVREANRGGTTTLETKTGYGLTVEDETRSARIAAEQVDAVTFLGAHVVPQAMDPNTYLSEVTGPMLSAVLPYVSAIDVFCERDAFAEPAAREVLAAGYQAGLKAHVHGNQLEHGPGVQFAVEFNALSVDHTSHS